MMNMDFERKLTIPMEVKKMYPVSAEMQKIVEARANALKDIFEGRDSRLVLMIGPCSADHEDSVLDYISRLVRVQEKVADKILIVPQIYTNKPRTTGAGYKGLLHQPDPHGKPDMFKGILATRSLHMRALQETGFSCADEMLYPENHRYLSDLLSYIAVGARSVENQQHRLTVSGMDIPAGMKNPTSGDISVMLKKSGKPTVLCVNKCDSVGDRPMEFYEFYNLGLGTPVGVSAMHGSGTGDLLDECFAYFPEETEATEEEAAPIKVAVIGKPNAGKSSLVNKILGEERVIVSNVAGTTRDAIDSYFENETGKYCFIDTAGMRRKSKVDDLIEKYSNMRTVAAIERADVCLILIDANDGVTEQDTKVAGYAHEKGKAIILSGGLADSLTLGAASGEAVKDWDINGESATIGVKRV